MSTSVIMSLIMTLLVFQCKVKKAVPVSDRVLRSHVAKHTFRGLTVTPLNGLDFD